MLLDLPVLIAPHLSQPPARRAPMIRVRLADGAPIGQSRPESSITPTIAIAQAVAIIRAERCLVSLPARGDLVRWPEVATTAAQHAGLQPAQLELSLLASQIPPGATSTLLALSALRDLGVQLALRGVRPPGNELLRRLPLSTIILAPTTPTTLSTPNGILALHRLMAQAAELGLQTVGTGIETEQHRALLSGLGCHFGEGPLFGHP